MTRKPTAEREYGFKRRVKLGKSKHSWESHGDADTLLKDVLHWLDLLAANDPQRFIFASTPAILKKCNDRRVRNKLKPASLSNLKHVFGFLQDLHIMSPYFRTWDGRYGFVFEPHDARCSVEHGVCIKHVYTSKQLESMRKNWPRESTLRSTDAALDEHSCSTAVALPVAPLSAFRSTVRSTPRSTAEDSKPTDCEELTDEQVAKWMAENVQAAAPKVSKVIRFEGSKVSKVTKEGDQEQVQQQEQRQERKATAVFKKDGDLTDEEQQQNQNLRPCASHDAENSIGMHFANATDLIDRVTDGELDIEDYHCVDGFADWTLLEKCIRAAVDAKKERPWLGLQTNAALMRDTMKRLKKQHNLNAPEPWLPIMDAMQGVTRAQRQQKKLETERKKPTYTEAELQKIRDDLSMAPCQEKNLRTGTLQVIFRHKADRIKMGFTVLGECTVAPRDSQGQTGKAVWHKATTPESKS